MQKKKKRRDTVPLTVLTPKTNKSIFLQYRHNLSSDCDHCSEWERVQDVNPVRICLLFSPYKKEEISVSSVPSQILSLQCRRFFVRKRILCSPVGVVILDEEARMSVKGLERVKVPPRERERMTRSALTQRSNVRRLRVNFLKFSLSSPYVRHALKSKLSTSHITGNLQMEILRDSQLVIFSLSTIFITFSYKRLAGFLAKFEAAKTGSGVGFLRLTAVSSALALEKRLHCRLILNNVWICMNLLI